MSHFLHTEADLDAALARLVEADPRLRDVLTAAGRPNLRRREAGFAGLCAIVVSQQLSTASAARSGAGLPPLSIRFSTSRSRVPAPTDSRASACRSRKSKP